MERNEVSMHSVLIVDDNIMDLEGIIKNIDWEELGFYICGKAYNGEQGFNLAISCCPDVVITDISMPIMNGIEMTSMIKEKFPNTLIIFMSCFDEFEFAKSAIDLNVNKYVLKPINLSELTETLRQLSLIKHQELAGKIYRENLEHKIKESLPLLQREFYQELLLGKVKSYDDIRKRMKYLEMDFIFNYISVMYIEIDNYELNFGNLPVDDKYILIEKIQMCINETILKGVNGFLVKQKDSSLIVVVFHENCENAEKAFNKSISLANMCKEYINAILKINITIGVSEATSSINEVYEKSKSAEYAVKSKFYSSGNSVLFDNKFNENHHEPHYNINNMKNELSDLLENVNDLQVDTFIDTYYGDVNRCSKYYLKTLSYSIINMIQILLLERNLSFKDILDNELIIWDKLSKYETIIDIKQWIKNILLATGASIKEREGSRYQKIVEDIKMHIDSNYLSIDNVSQVVDSQDISISYANSIFKKETGITIFEYLLRKKMEAAREMLKDPYCRINTIAEKLGYNSNAYFTSVFKQYNGLTPKEYRSRYCS